MKLTTKELKRLVTINNRVLLKPVQYTDHIILGGVKLYVNPGTRESETPVIYEVIKVPHKLVELPNTPGLDPMDWTTTIEIIEGDKVWINRNMAMKAQKISCDGIEYISIPYQFLYLTLRRWDPDDDGVRVVLQPSMFPRDLSLKDVMKNWEDTGSLLLRARSPLPEITNTRHKKVDLPHNVFLKDEKLNKYRRLTYYKVIMLNGYILFENLRQDDQSNLLWLPDRHMNEVGRIVFTGSRNKAYRHWKWPDPNYVYPGDIVHLKVNHRIALETELFAEFLDKKPYYISQRHLLLGKIKFRDI